MHLRRSTVSYKVKQGMRCAALFLCLGWRLVLDTVLQQVGIVPISPIADFAE